MNIKRFKELAVKMLPQGSVLRGVILSERDELAAEEFVYKTGTWLAILEVEQEKKDV